MKNVELVSAVINMQTVGQIWAHAILCMALETSGKAVPNPSASRSTRMESSPCWENWGCIQKRNLTQNKKKNAPLLFISSAKPPIFLTLDWSQSLQFRWIFSLLKDDRHQLWPVSILSYYFWHRRCEGDPISDLIFFAKLHKSMLVRYSERFEKVNLLLSKNEERRKQKRDYDATLIPVIVSA